MVARQALGIQYFSGPYTSVRLEILFSDTYIRPIAKRRTIFIFFLMEIRNFQTAFAGSIKMMMSDMMLNKQVMRISVASSTHLKSVISVFQIASRGEQAKIVIKALIQ